MAPRGFCVFETELGWCAVAWTARGVAAVEPPDPVQRHVRGRIARRAPHAAGHDRGLG